MYDIENFNHYQSFYCKIVSHLDSHTESFNEFMEEFKKIFPSEYNCQGHQFEIVTVIIFFINVILYIFGIIYIIIFIIEIIYHYRIQLQEENGAVQ